MAQRQNKPVFQRHIRKNVPDAKGLTTSRSKVPSVKWNGWRRCTNSKKHSTKSIRTTNWYLSTVVSIPQYTYKKYTYTPALRFYSRRLRSKLPILSHLLVPKVEQTIIEKKETQQERARYYYNRHSKNLPKLTEGQDAMMKRKRVGAGQSHKRALLSELVYCTDWDGRISKE